MSLFSNKSMPNFTLDTAKDYLQNALGGSAQGSAKNVGSMLPGLLGAGAVGGIAGALLSGKRMKKMAGTALTVGGGVAAGALVWNLYQKWAAGRNAAAEEPQQPAASSFTTALPQANAVVEPDSMIFLEAIFLAARADGHIDEQEQSRIQSLVKEMFPGQDMSALIETLLNRPIDPAALVRKVRSPQEGQALYRLSCFMVDVDHFMERAYLDTLAQNLKIEQSIQKELELEADTARRDMEAAVIA